MAAAAARGFRKKHIKCRASAEIERHGDTAAVGIEARNNCAYCAGHMFGNNISHASKPKYLIDNMVSKYLASAWPCVSMPS